MRLLLALILWCINLCYAQIVTVPIQGAPGISVTVGIGANALPLRDIRLNSNSVNITQGDDEIRHVPLGFTFPFFNKSFTDSWAATNGYVTFQDPYQSGLGGGCCSGVNLATTTDSRYNYTIYGIHSDLFSWNGSNQWYLRENNTMTYGWYNVSQCCSSQGGNSFEIKITSSGTVDTRIAGAMVNWSPVTSGMAGDLTNGEYYQYYYGNGLNISYGSSNVFSWNTNGGFVGADPCLTNPLYSFTCPGYSSAYLTQQCTITALYDPTCPGYQQSYFVYQCSINPLYNEMCPGYAEAYFNQQCSLNGLYDRKCPNYATAYATQQVLTTQPVTETQSTENVPIISDTTNSVGTITSSAAPSVSPANVTTAVPLIQTTPASSSPVSTISLSTTQITPAPQQTTTSQPMTRGQQLQQARMEAARKEAASKGIESMNETKEAKTMEQQVAKQSLIISAMGYNPGFDAYNIVIKDSVFYKSFEIYKGKENVDNGRVLRGMYGASENRHQQLLDLQYK